MQGKLGGLAAGFPAKTTHSCQMQAHNVSETAKVLGAKRAGGNAAMLARLFLVVAMALAMTGCGSSAAQEVVISFGGDVNFAPSRTNPDPNFAQRGQRLSIDELTQALHSIWQESHINFVNVETVVSETNGARTGKTFVFRSHPQQFRDLMGLGVNAFGLANNHTTDHGWPGIASTRAFFDQESARGRAIVYAGIGTAQENFAPGIARINGITVAMTALGIGTNGFAPGEERPGAYNIRSGAHVDQALASLARAEADIKLVSFHFGAENNLNATSEQNRLVRKALEDPNVDLVLGHHSHVPGPVMVDQDRHQAAFFSLGNYVFLGGASKDGDSSTADHGLVGQAYFSRVGGEFQLSAIRMTPLKGVHFQPRRLSDAAAQTRISHLNRLSRSNFSQSLAGEFTPIGDQGLMCIGPIYGPQARRLCCRGSGDGPSCVQPQLQ